MYAFQPDWFILELFDIRKLCEPERMYRWLMRQWYRQKEFLLGNQKKKPQKSKTENPPIVSAKPLLPLQFLLGLLDKAVGGAGAWVGAWWYFCVFLFAALVAVSQKKCVMVCCTQVCVVRFHQRRGSNTSEVVS